MVLKYIATLAVTVVAATLAATSLKFVTSSQVLSGNGLNENLQFEFTIQADGSEHYYVIDAAMAQFLQSQIRFVTQGPPHVVATNVQITPKQVSCSTGQFAGTEPCATLNVQLQWDTPTDSANGAHGSIFLDFPQIPEIPATAVTLLSGPNDPVSARRDVVRQVTAYRSASLVALARFVFALTVGLPLGILLHTLCWTFVLRGEKRKRLSALQPQGAGLPRTFYPNPVIEWVAWLTVLGLGAFTGCIILVAGSPITSGFMSSIPMDFLCIDLAITTAMAPLVTYFIGKYVLTVRVEPDGLSYKRGLHNQRWMSAGWSNILRVTQKSRTIKGNKKYWIEIELDDRPNLKIEQYIVDYAGLRDLLASMTAGQIR
jgi:hypothetical protein